MHVLPAAMAPVFELPGVEFTAMAAPSRGSKELCTWKFAVAAHLPPAQPHSLDRDEIFMITAGRSDCSPAAPSREPATPSWFRPAAASNWPTPDRNRPRSMSRSAPDSPPAQPTALRSTHHLGRSEGQLDRGRLPRGALELATRAGPAREAADVISLTHRQVVPGESGKARCPPDGDPASLGRASRFPWARVVQRRATARCPTIVGDQAI